MYSMTANLSIAWGQRIKRARNECGLSQRALAARADIDKGYYARIEAGQLGSRGVGDEVRMRLARALGRQVNDLFPYPNTTESETACPSAADAADGAPSATPATTAATPSPAPNAMAPAASVLAENPANE